MWKKVIEEESQNEEKGTESAHFNKVAEPILAINEEEEESGSREEQVEGEHCEEETEKAEWHVSDRDDSQTPEEGGDSEPQ